MAGMSVGGLASGLDTNSIVRQLTAIEQAKVTREVQKKTDAENSLAKFKELQTRLGTLAQKAAALETPDKFNVFKGTSNYEEYATVSGKEGATAGSYEVVVNKLATSQKVASKSISAVNKTMAEEGILTAGEATIKLSTSVAAQKADATKKTVEVKINSGDTLKDIVNKINAAEGAGVTASLMTLSNGDNRLVLTAVDTGTKGFEISESVVEGTYTNILENLGILSANTQQAASGNALITTDGVAATKDNTFEELSTVLIGQEKNNIKDGDVVGIYLPTNNGSGSGGWVTFNLYNGGSAKTIGEVLGEINTALGGAGANFEAKLNSSGEIVLEGDLEADGNFNSSNLKNAKIQILGFKSGYGANDLNGLNYQNFYDSLDPAKKTEIDTFLADPPSTLTAAEIPIWEEQQKQRFLDEKVQQMVDVKKDMGTFSPRMAFANEITKGENAFYTIDGMAITSQSNSDDKTISGTVFNLKKVSTPEMEPIKLSLALDKDAIISNITAFIDEFNALIKFIDENAKATIKEETDEITGIKKNSRVTGAFTGDAGISGMREQLKQMMTGTINELAGLKEKPEYYNGYSTAYSSLSRLGITTQKDGTISIERDKLSKALTTDFEGVRRLFTANWFSSDPSVKVGRFTKDAQTGVYEIDKTTGQVISVSGRAINTTEDPTSITNNISTYKGISFEVASGPGTAKVSFVRGIASMFTNWVELAKTNKIDEKTGRVIDGYYKASEKKYNERIESIQKRVDQLQVRVDNYNKRLVAQFNALERNMSNLQSQTANMMSALGNLSR